MAGEHIEDLRINVMEMDNEKIEENYNFLAKPQNMPNNEFEQKLSKVMDPEMVKSIIDDPKICLMLQDEYKRILVDRDDLRHTILKGLDDIVHLPVNVPRIIWNAKEQFAIKPNSKSNLHPTYAM